MNSAYADLLGMNQLEGTSSPLDLCNAALNSEDVDEGTLQREFAGQSETDLSRIIDTPPLMGLTSVDQGLKWRARQQRAKQERERRRRTASKAWRQKAQSNQQQYDNDSVKQQQQQQRRVQALNKSRDFSDDPVPDTSNQAPRQTQLRTVKAQAPAAAKSGTRSRDKPVYGSIGIAKSTAFKATPTGAPQGVSKHSSRQSGKRLACCHCHVQYGTDSLRHAKVFDGEDRSVICGGCWKKIHPKQAFPDLTDYDKKTLDRFAGEAQRQKQPQLEPAPLKNSLPRVAQQQQLAVKRRTRQSQQGSAKARQDDEEPICIDSDDDTHGNGAGPARDDGQSGAAVATRHSERIKESQQTKTLHLFKDLRCVFPPRQKFDVVEVTEHDLARLDEGEFLNDTVIDFFMKYIQESLDGEDRAKFHFFNTFFFKKLTEKSGPNKGKAGGREGTPEADPSKPLTAAERNHLRVKSWTKGVDIFSKDFLFIPIHDALHWSLIIVCHPGLDLTLERRPYILHLDSMDGSCHNLTPIGKAVRNYLNCEWQRKLDETDKSSVAASWAENHPGVKHEFTANTIPGKRPKVPNQDNWWDCGLFVLAYLDFWTHAPPGQVDLCAAGAFQGEVPYPAFLSKNWFQHTNASALRWHIRNIILKEFQAQTKLPEDHQAVLQAITDVAHYEGDSDLVKYIGPEEYLPAAQAAEQKRSEEKAAKQRREQQRKEDEAAGETANSQRAQRLLVEQREKAAKAAEARRQQSSSQELEIELDGSPDQSPTEDNSRKRAQPEDVQDLTGDQPKRRLRTRKSQAPSWLDQQVVDDDQSPPLAVRKSGKRKSPIVESEDDDVDMDVQQPLDTHQDTAQVAGEDSAVVLDSSSQKSEPVMVPDSQPEDMQPGTQDAMEHDEMLDHASADLIDQADHCQPPWCDASYSENNDRTSWGIPLPSLPSRGMHGKSQAANTQLFNQTLMTDPADHAVAPADSQARRFEQDQAAAHPATISRFFLPEPSQHASQPASTGWASLVLQPAPAMQPQSRASNGFQPLQVTKKLVRAVQGHWKNMLPSKSPEPAVNVSEEADADAETISTAGEQQPPACLTLELSGEEVDGRELGLQYPASPLYPSARSQAHTVEQPHQQSTSAGHLTNGNVPSQTMHPLLTDGLAGKHLALGQLEHPADPPQTHPLLKQRQRVRAPMSDQPVPLASSMQLPGAVWPDSHSHKVVHEASWMPGFLQIAAPMSKRQKTQISPLPESRLPESRLPESRLPESPSLAYKSAALLHHQQAQGELLTGPTWQDATPQATKTAATASVPAVLDNVIDLFSTEDSQQQQQQPVAASAPISAPPSVMSCVRELGIYAASEAAAKLALKRTLAAGGTTSCKGAASQQQQAQNSVRSLEAAEAQSSRLQQQHAQTQRQPVPSPTKETINLIDDEEHGGMDGDADSAEVARQQQESQQDHSMASDEASDEDYDPTLEASAWVKPSRKGSRASNRRGSRS